MPDSFLKEEDACEVEKKSRTSLELDRMEKGISLLKSNLGKLNSRLKPILGRSEDQSEKGEEELQPGTELANTLRQRTLDIEVANIVLRDILDRLDI
jgi:hypothetical protein